MSATVRAGYMQTEVGVLPNEWRVKSLGDMSAISSGGTPSRGRSEYWNGAIPWITTSQIDFTEIDTANQFITAEGLQNSAARLLPPGTLLLALYGQGKTRGKVGVLGIFAATNQACAAIEVIRDVSASFLLHFLTSQYDSIRGMSNGGSQDNLNSRIVKSILVPLPTPAEQRAIAAALSDVDALLAKLDALIAKKRDLKQAAMQQLLTGKTRLPGFSGEWDVKRFGDTLKVRHGRSQHEVVVAGGLYPILATGGEIGRTNVFLYDKASVLIGRKGTIDKPQYQDSPFWTVDTLFYTEIFNRILPKFIYYKFLMIDWRSYNEASGVPSLNASTIESIEVTMPTLDEQTAIATILSDMDAELVALEARRDKTRALKQGMMQELLTGRIRLV